MSAIARLFLTLCVIASACAQPAGNRNVKSSVDIIAKADSLIEPDVVFLRNRLFAFLESHKHLDSFDTVDWTYAEYWGIVHYPPYTVESGRLFTGDQVHALVYYADEQTAGMHIYLKRNKDWLKVFEDTSIYIYGGTTYPRLEDWNKDGMKDILIPQYHVLDKAERYNLWLMNKNGIPLPVEGFSEILNPEADSQSCCIVARHYSAGNELYSKYRFSGHKLIQVYDVHIWYTDSKDCDSQAVIWYNRNGRTVHKQKYTRLKNLDRYLPEDLKGSTMDMGNEDCE